MSSTAGDSLRMPLLTPQPALDDATPDLDALRRGESAALGACYRRHAADLLATAYRLTASVEDAEDIVHDIFVDLPELLGHYEERGQFGGWLTRLAIRRALMHKRRTKRAQIVYADSVGMFPVPETPTQPDHFALRHVHHALAALSPTLRHVFVLRAVHQLSHAEIAALLGIAVGTSEVRLHRAVRQLRQLLEVIR